MTITIPVWILYFFSVIGLGVLVLLATAGLLVVLGVKDWEFWR